MQDLIVHSRSLNLTDQQILNFCEKENSSSVLQPKTSYTSYSYHALDDDEKHIEGCSCNGMAAAAGFAAIGGVTAATGVIVKGTSVDNSDNGAGDILLNSGIQVLGASATAGFAVLKLRVDQFERKSLLDSPISPRANRGITASVCFTGAGLLTFSTGYALRALGFDEGTTMMKFGASTMAAGIFNGLRIIEKNSDYLAAKVNAAKVATGLTLGGTLTAITGLILHAAGKTSDDTNTTLLTTAGAIVGVGTVGGLCNMAAKGNNLL